jgi:hypothetical protein
MKKPSASISRRDVLVGTGAALTASRGVAQSPRTQRTQRTPRFDIHSFVEECRRANQETAADKQTALRELLS